MMKVEDCMKCEHYELRKTGIQRKQNMYYCNYLRKKLERIDKCPLGDEVSG